MQLYYMKTNSVVCDTSKGSLFKQVKAPLVGEHAFRLTGFACKTTHVTLLDFSVLTAGLVSLLLDINYCVRLSLSL